MKHVVLSFLLLFVPVLCFAQSDSVFGRRISGGENSVAGSTQIAIRTNPARENFVGEWETPRRAMVIHVNADGSACEFSSSDAMNRTWQLTKAGTFKINETGTEYYLSADGNRIIRTTDGKEWKRSASPAAEQVSPAGSFAFSDSAWDIDGVRMELRAGGIFYCTWQGGEFGKWKVPSPGVIEITKEKNNEFQRWRLQSASPVLVRDGDKSRAKFVERLSGNAGIVAGNSDAISGSALPERKPSLADEFAALRKQANAAYVNAMSSYDARDKSSLETLRTRVGTDDLDLQKTIKEALDDVAASRDIDYDEPTPAQRRSQYIRDFWDLKTNRDRSVLSAKHRVLSGIKLKLENLKRRAVTAGSIDLAGDIEAEINFWDMLNSPFVGRWETGRGYHRVIIKSNGTYKALSGEFGQGTWKNVGTNLTITRDGGGLTITFALKTNREMLRDNGETFRKK